MKRAATANIVILAFSTLILAFDVHIDNTSADILFAGSGWRDFTGLGPGWYSRTAKSTNTANDSLVYTHPYCTNLAWNSSKNVDKGMADVYIDGVLMKTVDAYAPALAASSEMYRSSALTAGKHTIKVINKNQKNPSANANWLECDKIVVTTQKEPGLPTPVAMPLPSALPGAVYTNNTDYATTSRGTRYYGIASGKIVYFGSWTYETGDSSYYSTDHHLSNTQFSVCYFTFKGTAVRWIGSKRKDHGVADVYIDGQFQRTVDSYDAGWITKAVLFEKAGLSSDRTHTLKIVVRKERNSRATNCYQDIDCFEAASPVNYDAEISSAQASEYLQIRNGTHPYLTPALWNPVAYTAKSPPNGVMLQPGVFGTCFNTLIKYLNTSYAGASYYCGEDYGCWGSWLPGSSEGRMLVGAANILRWEERADMRAIVTTLVEKIKARQRADGYHDLYPETDFALTDKSANNERKNYDRVFWTRGLLAAGESGNADAYQIARKFYDWYNSCSYLPRMLDGPNAHNGFPGGGLIYFSPVGKSDDLVVTQRYYDQYSWRTELANAQPFCISNYPAGEPHTYELLGLEAFIDEYRATGDPACRDAVLGGWKAYRDNFVHIGGTAAICEDQYYPPQSFYLSRYTGEACGHNLWLWVNSRLLQLYPTEEKYAAEIEKVIYNGVMAAQDPGKGYIRYINRIHGRKDEPWCRTTCCEVSTVNVMAKLPEYIYSIADDGLYVNLFAASKITWKRDDRDITLAMTTEFPNAPDVALKLTTSAPETMALRIRIPSWASGGVSVQVNGNSIASGAPGTYVSINRTWANSDSIRFVLPAKLTTVKYAGFDQIGEYERHALFYGPVLLSLAGPLSGPGNVPLISTDAQNLPGILSPIAGTPLQYTIAGYPNYKYLPYWQVSSETFTCFPLFPGQLNASPTGVAGARLLPRNVTLSVNQMPRSGASKIKIRYAVPATLDGARIRLVLFDMRGRLVRTLIDESRAAGNHTSTIDVRHVSAGRYFFRMVVRSERQSLVRTAQLTMMR